MLLSHRYLNSLEQLCYSSLRSRRLLSMISMYNFNKAVFGRASLRYVSRKCRPRNNIVLD